MQTLSLSKDRFDNLNHGTKNTTIRLGRRDINKGELLLTCSEAAEKSCLVYVTDIRIKTWADLNNDDAIANGYASREILHEKLAEFYPDAKDNDELTIIVFTKKD